MAAALTDSLQAAAAFAAEASGGEVLVVTGSAAHAPGPPWRQDGQAIEADRNRRGAHAAGLVHDGHDPLRIDGECTDERV